MAFSNQLLSSFPMNCHHFEIESSLFAILWFAFVRLPEFRIYRISIQKR